MQAERQTGRQRALISYIVTFGHFSIFILYKKTWHYSFFFFFFGKATTVIKCERAISSLCELLWMSDLGIFPNHHETSNRAFSKAGAFLENAFIYLKITTVFLLLHQNMLSCCLKCW